MAQSSLHITYYYIRMTARETCEHCASTNVVYIEGTPTTSVYECEDCGEHTVLY